MIQTFLNWKVDMFLICFYNVASKYEHKRSVDLFYVPTKKSFKSIEYKNNDQSSSSCIRYILGKIVEKLNFPMYSYSLRNPLSCKLTDTNCLQAISIFFDKALQVYYYSSLIYLHVYIIQLLKLQQ